MEFVLHLIHALAQQTMLVLNVHSLYVLGSMRPTRQFAVGMALAQMLIHVLVHLVIMVLTVVILTVTERYTEALKFALDMVHVFRLIHAHALLDIQI